MLTYYSWSSVSSPELVRLENYLLGTCINSINKKQPIFYIYIYIYIYIYRERERERERDPFG